MPIINSYTINTDKCVFTCKTILDLVFFYRDLVDMHML